MNFNEAYCKDPRSRFYRPAVKLLFAEKTLLAENLIGNTSFQNVIHYVPAPTVIQPGGSVILDFGSAFHGGIRINPWGKNVVLRVRFGESVSETLNVANEDCSRKNALLELPNYGQFEYGNTVFRFVRLINETAHDVAIQGLTGVVLERDIAVTGAFESSDEKLNQIWKTSVRTVHLCMQDFLYDGAKRDRIVWMGDMHPEIKTILCAFSDTSIIPDSLEFILRQTPENAPTNEIYTYSCWLIISLWDYLCATGDGAFIRKHSNRIRSFLAMYRKFVKEDGSEAVPERRFLDWPNNDSIDAKHAGIQALLLWMFQCGAKLLHFLGEDAAGEEEAQKLLCRHVPDPAGRKAPAALLTLTGLADFQHILEKDPFRDVSTFYGYYVLQAKRTIPALELIRKYWGGMLEMGATSFWEDFDLDWMENSYGIDSLPVPGKRDIHGDFGNYCYKGLRHSLSHGWSSGPAPFLSERVLGVSFPAPGKVRIQPDLGDLKEVSGIVPSSFGPIEVEVSASGKKRVKIPDGLEEIQ